MRRFVLGLTALLALASVTLVAAAFAFPTDETAEPRNQIHRLEHETQYDSFVPVHYPDLGVWVIRHESWVMSVYLDRDPTSGCALEWVSELDAYSRFGDDYPRHEAPYGVFYDEALGTMYDPDGAVVEGPGAAALSRVRHTMPYNTVHVADRDIRMADHVVLPHRVCSD